MDLELDVASTSAVGKAMLGGAVILTPSTSVTFENCDELGAALEQANEQPRPTVVIDCRQVNAMDSAALELLTDWNRRLRENSGIMKLANLNDVCVDILMVTRLVHVLNVCEDVDRAVQDG